LQQVADDGAAEFSLAAVLKLHYDVGSVLNHLQRTADYGGGESLTVKELIQRYEQRLNHIRLKDALSAEETAPEIHAIKERVMQKPLLGGEPTAVMEEEQPGGQLMAPLQRRTTRSAHARPGPANPAALKHARQRTTPVPRPRNPTRAAALKSFFMDSPISLMVFLGAFLILMATLTFVLNPTNPAHRPDPLLALLVVLGTQVFFGAAGVGTRRLSKFINVARIYAFVFVLLIPVLGIEGYLILERQTLHIGLPTTIVIAGVYAAIAYCAFAVYQRFSPFGYLGMAALVTADLATVGALHLGIEWYPCALMVLALPALVSMRSSTDKSVSSLAVLRNPLRICMFVLVASAVVMFPLFFYIFPLNHVFGLEPAALRLAKLSTLLLLLIWGGLFLWLTKLSRRAVPAVPYVLLVGVLDLAHTLDFSLLGYALALTGVVLLYHAFSRFALRLLEPFGKLALRLDQIALLLVSVIPLLIAPQVVPILLYHAALSGVAAFFSSPLSAWTGLVVLIVGVLLTIDVTLYRANAIKAEILNRWPWLLLLSGVLFTWFYAVVMLPLFSDATWAFLALTLGLVAAAVFVRRRFGGLWANPLDVLALAEALLTLNIWSLHHPTLDNGGGLLLFFAALFYLVLLYQRRQKLLIVPFLFAIAALAFLPMELWLLLSICLPVASVVVTRFRHDEPLPVPQSEVTLMRLVRGLEWPLQAIGFICGVLVTLQDVNTHTSTLQIWSGMGWSLAIEIGLLCLTWYLTAVLTHRKEFLLLATGFAVVALWFSSLPFWTLVGVATSAACLGLAVSRLFARSWALPLYTVALLAVVLTGLSGFTHYQFSATAWVLLGFALLAYLIGIVEEQVTVLWLLPVFVSCSLVASLLLNDQYRVPLLALLCTLAGIGIGIARWIRPTLAVKLLRYALPFYVAALIAAILTGLSGMLIPSSELFHLSIPFVLLGYAVIAYAVSLYERRSHWLFLAAGFAVWGLLLLPQTIYVICIGLGCGIAGLLAGQIYKRTATSREYAQPFYILALVAAVLTGIHGLYDPFSLVTTYALLAFAGLMVLIMLVERLPALLLAPAGMVAWAIWTTHWDISLRLIASVLLCVLLFATQFIWRNSQQSKPWLTAIVLPRVLGLGGLLLVILVIISLGSPGQLAHIGAGTLTVLALLIAWLGYDQHETRLRHACNYVVGLLFAFVISWELMTFGQTKLDILLLAPASYLSVIAPFLMRDKEIGQAEHIGRLVAILGAALLLLPTGVLSLISNNQDNLLSTLLLLGEALSLFFLGIVTRVRFFILGGAGLIIAGALRALFLPSSPILIWTMMAVSGGALLIGATLYILLMRGREERVPGAE
jgi:hypothetical protein